MLLGTWDQVIKIEEPEQGDYRARYLRRSVKSGPASSAEPEQESVTLNLKKPKAGHSIEVIESGADVLIEQFRPGDDRPSALGIKICKRSTRLVYCSLGFGRTGLPRYRRP